MEVSCGSDVLENIVGLICLCFAGVFRSCLPVCFPMIP